MTQIDIVFKNHKQAMEIYGNMDGNLKILEKEFLVELSARGERLSVSGDEHDVELARRAIAAMEKLLKFSEFLDEQSVLYCINLIKQETASDISELDSEHVLITPKGKPIKPKTLMQKKYIEAMKNNTVVIGVGPAGTGKTYLAVAMAVRALKSHDVARIILTRPAVEAGEKLGFLPGDLQNKVDPYLRPLYDALFDTLGQEAFARNLEKGIIEVAPLAYMRGRTLDGAFIILDEAQNTTKEQMKMFLTRLGNGSKMVVNGDITQIDLPGDKKSGLVDAMAVLKGIDDITQIKFSDKDVVRSKLVSDIIRAYDKQNAPARRQHGK